MFAIFVLKTNSEDQRFVIQIFLLVEKDRKKIIPPTPKKVGKGLIIPPTPAPWRKTERNLSLHPHPREWTERNLFHLHLRKDRKEQFPLPTLRKDRKELIPNPHKKKGGKEFLVPKTERNFNIPQCYTGQLCQRPGDFQSFYAEWNQNAIFHHQFASSI